MNKSATPWFLCQAVVGIIISQEFTGHNVSTVATEASNSLLQNHILASDRRQLAMRTLNAQDGRSSCHETGLSLGCWLQLKTVHAT